jgi:3-methylfumaryl-CoA hydratase
LDYTQNVEGYPGLVVHGPMLATLLAGVLEKPAELGVVGGAMVRSLTWSARAPTFGPTTVAVHAEVGPTTNAGVTEVTLSLLREDGKVAIKATAILA